MGEDIVLRDPGGRLVLRRVAVADGTITDTTFKRDGHIWNEVDVDRVWASMERVEQIRGQDSSLSFDGLRTGVRNDRLGLGERWVTAKPAATQPMDPQRLA